MTIPAHPAWQPLAAHHRAICDRHLRDLFAHDPTRGERMRAEAAGINLDYSKNRITDETLPLLFDLAEAVDLRGRIAAMFRGDTINVSENRAVLHVALRAPRDATIGVEGENVVPAMHAVLDRVAAFSDRIRGGDWKGYTGRLIRNVVNSCPRRVYAGGGDRPPDRAGPEAASRSL